MKHTTLALAMILASTVHAPAQEKTPLFDAARNGTPADIAALLNAGADPKARDRHGNTPLHSAASNENPAVIPKHKRHRFCRALGPDQIGFRHSCR